MCVVSKITAYLINYLVLNVCFVIILFHKNNNKEKYNIPY